MLPGDPTMEELPNEMPVRLSMDDADVKTVDIGPMSHQELIDLSAASMEEDPLAAFYRNPPGVAIGRQAYITGVTLGPVHTRLLE